MWKWFRFIGRGRRLETGLIFLVKKVQVIMATQAEVAAELANVTNELTATKDQVAKIGTETSALIAKVGDQQTAIDQLTAELQNMTVTPELQIALANVKAASAAVKSQAQVVDDLVPDAPAPSP